MNVGASILLRALKRVFFGRWMVPFDWPSGVDRSAWQPVQVQSQSGASIACLHGASYSDQAIATLVLAHPLGRLAKGYWLQGGQAEFLRRAGYNVLLFDFNGFGESELGSFDYPADVIAAGQLATRLHPALPVGLLGASFGAGFGLCSLADRSHPYACAFLEAAFLSLPSYWQAHRTQATVLGAMSWLAPALARRLHPELAAANVVHGPAVHLLYGGQDAVTPPDVGHRLMRALTTGTDAQMTELTAAGHVNAYRSDPRRYRTCLLRFFDSTFIALAARESGESHHPTLAIAS